MDLHILPECYVDTNLVETIVPPTNSGYSHRQGCDSVAKAMMEAPRLKDGFALGIVDQDKKRLKYSEEFELITDRTHLKLLKHPLKDHYLIYIVPAIEKFIIYNADEVNVDLRDFGLPHNYKELTKHTKNKDSSKNPKFKKLFKALINAEAPGVMLLSKWILYLKDHPNNSNLDFFREDEE